MHRLSTCPLPTYLMLFFILQHVHAQEVDTIASSTNSIPTRVPNAPTATSHWQCGSLAEPVMLV